MFPFSCNASFCWAWPWVSCGQAPRFTAPPTPSAPPSYAPSHCGTPGINLSGAPCAAAPHVCAPPGFGALSTQPRPFANTIPGFPFAAPPPSGFPFNPELASVAVGQVPPATPANVAPSTNPASVPSVCDDTRYAPYLSSQPVLGCGSESRFLSVSHWDPQR